MRSIGLMWRALRLAPSSMIGTTGAASGAQTTGGAGLERTRPRALLSANNEFKGGHDERHPDFAPRGSRRHCSERARRLGASRAARGELEEINRQPSWSDSIP